MNYKRNVFGIDFDIEVDIVRPILDTWQRYYEFRLNNFKNSGNSDEFIKFALRFLPNQSFIILTFNNSGAEFIQFGRQGSVLILDIPIWSTNAYGGKRRQILKLLKIKRIKKIAFKELEKDNSILVFFEDSYDGYEKAMDFSYGICKQIFKRKKPILTSYFTGRLQNVK